MELAFDKKSLRSLCESETKAKKELGDEMAEILKRRLADLRAATYVNDLPVGMPREISHASKQIFAVDLCEDISIIFCANHSTTPLLSSGKIDWSKVYRIKILEIGEAHG